MKIVNLHTLPFVESRHNNIFKKVMIGNGELPHISTFAQATLKPGDIVKVHDHNGRYEIFLVEKGKMKIIFNNTDEHIAEEGSCITTEPHEIHEVSNPFNEDLVFTYFQVKV